MGGDLDARLLMSECSKGWLIDKGELFKHKVMSEALFLEDFALEKRSRRLMMSNCVS